MPRLEMMDEDRIIEEVLDKFVNCHEQTYEEFLSTFSHLSKENNVARTGLLGTDSTERTFTSVKCTHQDEPNDYHLRNKTIFLCTSSQCSEEEQIVIGEGQKVGSFFQGDLNRAGKVKVDNFLALEDLDMDSDEETKPQMSKDLLLPGEVEEEVSTFTPSCVLPVARPLSPEVKPKPTVKGTDTRDETLGDEVQPFSLDEEFDYDSVTLTPKFPAAEMEMLRELSKQRRENNTDSERPCD